MGRGYTLVELMITVAIVGIGSAIIAGTARYARLGGLAELQRERALLLLEYHAECLVDERPVDPTVVERLVVSLPDAEVVEAAAGDLAILTVRWSPPQGLAQERSLTVFTAGVR